MHVMQCGVTKSNSLNFTLGKQIGQTYARKEFKIWLFYKNDRKYLDLKSLDFSILNTASIYLCLSENANGHSLRLPQKQDQSGWLVNSNSC